MTERKTFTLLTHTRRAEIAQMIANMDLGTIIEIIGDTRTAKQNRAIHSLVGQIMKQRPVHRGVKMDMARYKAVFMQALGHEMTMLPSLEEDGVWFPMGLSTSKLKVSEFNDLMELVFAWCAREGLTIKHFDDAKDGEAPNKASPKAA